MISSTDLLAYLFVALLAVAVRWPDLAMPLERDEGEYAYAAQVIERGGVPYRDAFCQKPPLVFFWYLAAFRVFGESATGIHLMMAAATAVAACGLYRLTRHLANRPAGLLAATAFVLASAGPGYFGSAANTELFTLVPVVWGVEALRAAAERDRRWLWFLAGVLLGLATLTKQVAVFSFLGPIGFCLLYRKGSRSTAAALAPGSPPKGKGPGSPLPRGAARPGARGLWRMGDLVALAAGVLAAVLPVLGWLAGVGAWQPFLEATVEHNLAYVGFPFAPWKWQHLAAVWIDRFLVSDGALWACTLLGLLGLLHPSVRREPGLAFGLTWFLTSFLGVAVGPYGFGHYFLQVVPPLALVAGVVCWGWMERLPVRGTGPRLLAGAASLAVLVPLAVPRVRSLGESVDQRSFELYRCYGDPPFVAARAVGSYLRTAAEPDAPVFVVGSEPEVLFYCGRRSSTRYVIFYPLTDPYPRAKAMEEAMFAQCTADPPAQVVVCYCASSLTTDPRGGGPKRVRHILARVDRMLASGYREEARVWADHEGRVTWTTPGAPKPPGARCLFQIFGRS
jgi:4-amino-4-deoxy-L-arabinose transferase-like glycosyltransferase